ncbi:hypothetical protein [Amphibacillus cookii]|uniref:hypothetical protein n=1 Tax=Amphibacillus cookii TaxID=767787 RepID=UPI00195EA55A|nr:hypothetical protein [Amphibacillus cookii]MBM7540326.1 ABC-type antimicrobial peptide transport system permease subunit [Amphibacillus cookii]
MSSIAILAAAIFFFLAATTSLFMFIKGYGKSYLIITLITLILVYLIFGLSELSTDALTFYF